MKLFLAFIFSPLFLLPQPHSEKIYWNENEKLSWDDFRGTPRLNVGFVASTGTGIDFKFSYSISGNEAKVSYSVQSFFNPQESWYLQDKVSQNVLNHEQAHFDISEIHARILRKRLAEKRFSKNVKSEIEGIFLKVEAQRKAMQKKFDAETDHSQNLEKEKAWEMRIAQKLKEYEPWK